MRAQFDLRPAAAQWRRLSFAINAFVVTIALGWCVGLTLGQDAVFLTDNDPAAQSSDPAGTEDFDSLLRMAEQDVSQLTQVKVAQRVPSLDTEVTTVSRTASTVGKSAAAVFVITNDMIRRSGATSIPEVLRMAPGVNVARIDSNKWAVSIRGFNGLYDNKLLVQIDGRLVYSPLFGGVFWAAQDVFLEDVDRIEIIRGPGSSLYGFNAVNGIINIITKPPSQTQGAYAQAAGGNYDRGFVNARYGGQIGQDIDYRIYGKCFERGTGIPVSGPAFDDWRSARAGFRMQYDPGRSGCDIFTLQGDSYSTTAGTQSNIPTTSFPFAATLNTNEVFHGSNMLGRWQHVIDDERDWQLQTYYDFTQFSTGAGINAIENRDTWDIDFQHRFPLTDAQRIVWGTGYRATSDHISYPPFPAGFTTPHQVINIYSYFLQDEITLVPDRWTTTLGCKFLNNTYTNFEYQPSARLLFTPSERQSAWASVSRAVRLPSRVEETIIYTSPPAQTTPFPIFPQLVGNQQLVAENLLAWECGYRAAPTDAFSWDLALFFNQYDNLIGSVPGLPQISPIGIILPVQYQNAARAQSYGYELAANLAMNERWQLRGAYSFLIVDVLGSGPVGASTQDAEGTAPHNQVYLQSGWTYDNGVRLDLIGRYADSLVVGNVPAYFVGDVRLAWQYSASTEFLIVGRNLFDNGHHEFGTAEAVPTGVRSEVYAGVTIRR